MDIQKKFGTVYKKKQYAGFVGKEDLVRTPTKNQCLVSVLHYLMSLLEDADTERLEYIKGVALKIKEKSSIEGKPGHYNSEKIDDELLETFYWEPCMLDCGNKGCREWVDMYSYDKKNVYCHVSDCELEEDKDFESVLKEFYSELSSKQEPLGNDLKKVLYDNLWELYE